MPTIPFHSLPAGPRWKRRGVAIILVLACVVLLTVMVLAFLGSIGPELQSSKFYASGSSVKLLGQSATDLVMAEIRDATANGALCWASQPGMIRTWDNTGTLQSYYKLYSDAGMVINPKADTGGTAIFTSTQTQIPDGTGGTLPDGTSNSTAWYNLKGVYVDLNQPLATTVNGSTVNQYPILDGDKDSSDLLSSGSVPAAAGVPSGALVMGPLIASGTYQNYPQVAGFWLNQSASTAPNVISPATPADPSSANNAPMPVRWLYVLKNGGMAVPSGVASGVVSFFSTDPITGFTLPTPTAANPIVGRIAFWTDDDTSKVNINTAGESLNNSGASTVWDVPRTLTLPDEMLALCQPAQNEFQRYPGHPATVSLSAVLGSLTTDSKFPDCLFNSPTTSIAATGYAGITPRLNGSKAGSAMANPPNFDATVNTGPGSLEGTQVPNGVLSLANSRLYATPDELLFQPGRNALTNANLSNPTAGTTAALAELDAPMLRRTEFFLTARSRAPDVNVFNQPRISVWPISVNTATTYRTPADQLIAFCTTVNGYPYYFQRGDTTASSGTTTVGADDPTADLPTTAPSSSNTGVNRNRNLMEYLRYLTQQPIPGFGGAFGGTGGKYAAGDTLKFDSALASATEDDQILTEIFDYIRCTNTYDHSTGSATFVPYTAAAGTVGSTTTNALIPGGAGSYAYNPGMGQVVPIVDQYKPTGYSVALNTRGFGRFPTLHSATLMFFAVRDDGKGPTQLTATVAGGNTSASPTQIQAVLALQFFDPSMGFPVNCPWMNIQVSGLGGLQWPDGRALFSNGTIVIGNPFGGTFGGISGFPLIGGVMDFRRLILASFTPSAGPGPIAPNVITGEPVFTNWNPGSTNQGAFTTTTTGNTGTLFSSLYPSTPMAGTSSATTLLPSGPTSTVTFTLKQNVPTTPVTVTIYRNQWSNAGTPITTTALQTIQFYFNGGTCVVPSPPNCNGFYPSSNKVPTQYHAPNISATPNAAASGWELWTNRLEDVQDSWSTYYATPTYPYAGNFMSSMDSTHSVVSTTGDFRLLAARVNVGPVSSTDSFFMTHPAHNSIYNTAGTVERNANELQEAGGATGLGESSAWAGSPTAGPTGGTLVPYSSISSNPYFGLGTGQIINNEYGGGYGGNYAYWCDAPSQSGVFAGGSGAVPGDWDNGVANIKDGPYINKADEGNTGTYGNAVDYFDYSNFTATGSTFFSPNRMIPSAGMFGSLPTGVLENKPWQTLLFRPGPSGHPGLGAPAFNATSNIVQPPYTSPPDHLFMDLFTMPVVEPYAISEPLSTAGRINMNYQIVPFTYINRSTAVQAALRSVSVMAIPNVAANQYKSQTYGTPSGSLSLPYRQGVNMSATLSQFNARFNANDIFHAPSEICSIDLVPSNYSTTSGVTALSLLTPGTSGWRAAMDTYWNSYALTGDNTRERPYANLYPLLTTKSNTFTIHYRVQSLKPPVGSNMTTWTESSQYITGEYRGSQTIERYVDANDTSIPDFTSSPSTTQTLAPYYKFRVVATHQFAP